MPMIVSLCLEAPRQSHHPAHPYLRALECENPAEWRCTCFFAKLKEQSPSGQLITYSCRTEECSVMSGQPKSQGKPIESISVI